MPRQESKTRDAETLNELTGNIEFLRQQQAAEPPATPPVIAAEPPTDGARPEPEPEPEPLAPVVGTVEIVETGSGLEDYTGLEYTTYVMRCRAAAPTPTAEGDSGPADSAQEPAEWTVTKRFSDFSNLRTELAALPTIGAVVETMAFPASTWAFLPWGAGKLDEATIAERKTGLQTWLNSLLGTFPSEPAVRRFLCEAPADAPADEEPDPGAAEGRSVESPVVGRMAVALWAFEPPAGQEGTHVALQKGEAVRVLKEVSADWWYVEVGRSGERGYVPATYIKDDADG